MKKLQNTVNIAILGTEFSHIFCCVLPTVFTLASLLAGFGMISAMPIWLENFHEMIHDWEIPLIIFSAIMISFGWGLHWYSQKIDCHDTGCSHPPCEPTKVKTSRLLLIATALFVVNVGVYLGIHRAMEVGAIQVQDNHDHGHDHHGHDH